MNPSNLYSSRIGPAIVLLVGALAVAATACSDIVLKQPALRMQYHSLDYPAVPAEQPARIATTIGIQRFRVAPDYNSRQIIYSESDHTKNAYFYHQWRSHPGDLVPYLLARDLDRSGHFMAAYPPGSKPLPAFRMEGSLDDFYELDEGENYRAVLSMTITVVHSDPSRRIPEAAFHRHYTTEEPMNGRSADQLAGAMSRALARISTAIGSDLAQALAAASLSSTKDFTPHDPASP